MLLEDTSIVTVDRCVFELRQGRPIIVAGDTGSLLLATLEPQAEASRHWMEALAPRSVELLLNGFRARRLELADDAVSVPVAETMRTGFLERLGYGQPSLAEVSDARRRAADVARDELADAGFYLARLAETIPALLAVRSSPPTTPIFAALRDRATVLATTARSVATFRLANASAVRRLAEAPVPLPSAPAARFVAFRSRDSLGDHVAVVIGDPSEVEAPLARLHSSCLTGDIFRSLRCDCGEQLETAIAAMAEAGGGVICYLAQEGRGIGIANKLRTYALQNAGLDTLEANEALGFAPDEREFAIAALMLRDLGVRRVRLMTNNPEKIERLREFGVDVAERVGLRATLNPHNERYISARVAKNGYLHAVNG
ncbi:MAG: GTP cyclohydrolase II [Pseudomonadota bacterium]